jgi:sugar lactone lactonase YvrE
MAWGSSTYGSATQILISNGVTLSNPTSLSLDTLGNIIVADAGNNRVLELEPVNAAAYSSEVIANATNGLSSPSAVFVDRASNIYIADTGNNRIVKIHWCPVRCRIDSVG